MGNGSRRRVVMALPVMVGLVLSGVLVWHSSDSAFSPTGAGNGQAGPIGGEAAGPAMPQESGPVARLRGQQCIRPVVNGSAPALPTLYVSTDGAIARDIERYILMTIETDAQGAAFAACDGFTADGIAFQGTLDQLVSGRPSWVRGQLAAPRVPPEMTGALRVTWRLDPASTRVPDGSILDVSFVDKASRG